jgi:predicted RND superfamily exporter protein
LKRFLNTRNSIPIFLWALVAILCFLAARNLDLSPQRLLAKNDPDKIFYQQFKEQFKAAAEEESIFIALTNNKGIFQKDFLEKVDSLANFLGRSPGILRVYSLTNEHVIFFNGGDINARPLLHVGQPAFYKEDSIYLFQSKEYLDLHISKDSRSIAIGAFNDPAVTGKQKDELVRSINSKMEQLGFDEAHFVAKAKIEKNSKELVVWLVLGFVLILILFFLLFRSLRDRLVKNKLSIAVFLILLAIISAFYISKREFNFHLRDAVFGKTKADLKFIDNNFYGSRPFEMVVTMKNGQQNFYDIDMMKKLEEIENYLKDSLNVGAVISPISLFKGANKAFHGGENAYFKIPGSAQEVARFTEAIYQTEYADEMERYMLQDGSSVRISGRLADIGSKEFKPLSQKFDRFFNNHKYSNSFSYRLTGPAILIDKASNSIKCIMLAGLISFFLYLLILLLSLKTPPNKNHFSN